MSRSEIYTKFQFSVLNDSCLIHITIENCKISGENDLFIFLPGKIDKLRVREFYGECFIHILITLRFVLSWKSIFVIERNEDCRYEASIWLHDQHEKFEQRRLRKITTSLLQTNILLLIPVNPQKQQYCDLSKFILWKKRAMIDNSLELLKSDHATLINFKPISSHFLKIIFNIAISQSRWV